MSGKQSEAFLNGEGDAWFTRNRERLLSFDPEKDLVCNVIEQDGIQPKRILEIGAANGFRIAALGKKYACPVVGTDASVAATEDGRRRFGIDLVCAPAESLDGIDGTFDLVVIHFLLHWLDRHVLPQLLAGVAERLQPGGHLVLGDFHPDHDEDVPYHHLPGESVMTYKRDYGRLFEDSGPFDLKGITAADHETMLPSTTVASADRIAIWLLERSDS